MQTLISEMSMSSTLPSSPPPSVYTWITSLDIIDDFHLDLPCPHLYHHIPYALSIKSSMCFANPFTLVNR
jgi:hypothetical protein